MKKKKILVFTIPNDGHLNILKKMIKAYGKNYLFQLVLIGKKNTLPDLSDLRIKTFFLKKSHLYKNTQSTSVFQRVYDLLDECIQITSDFKPDLIIYDFPAIEGYFVGKILKIPYWCSIPGMIGPFIHQKYLTKSLSTLVNQKALLQIEEKYAMTINRKDIEVISNCLHMPGQINLLWSYRAITPAHFMRNRKKNKYVFVGYLVDNVFRKKKKNHSKQVVYFSLGTEVMDNLWINQRKTREGVKRLIEGVSDLWKDKSIKVIYVTQGKKVLSQYPDNWQVLKKVNQQKVLSEADLFITHGGSNSFHEAMVLQIPMIFIPFFGDQPLVSERAEQLGIGINLVKDDNIEKKKHKDFLNAKLIDALDTSVFKILVGKQRYLNQLKVLNLKSNSLKNMIDTSI